MGNKAICNGDYPSNHNNMKSSYNMADTLELLSAHKDIVDHNHPEMILVIVLPNLMLQERKKGEMYYEVLINIES